MEYSKHASARMSQRGLSHELVSLIYNFGTSEYAKNGAVKITLKKRDLVELNSCFQGKKQLLDKAKRKVLILTHDEKSLITVY